MNRLYTIISMVIYMLIAHISNAAPEDGKYYLQWKGLVKQPSYDGVLSENLLDSVLVIISDRSQKVIETFYSDKNGNYQFRLPLNKQFVIRMSKNGFVGKSILINSSVPDSKISGYTFLFDIYLFKEIKELDVSVLKVPVANVIFDKSINGFNYDHYYTDLVNEKLKKTYSDYYRQTENENAGNLANTQKNNNTNIVTGKEVLPIDKVFTDIIFRVQFIALSRPVPLTSKLFSSCGYVDESFVNGMYKYTSGEFKNLLPAQAMLADLKSKGFKDAFIVAIKNNKRVAVGVAVNMLAD